MKTKKLYPLTAITAALLLGSTAAVQAQSPGIYVGAAWGGYSINESNLDANDDVFKTLIGFQFSPLFGLEGSWTDFNRVNNAGDRFEADGRGLSGVLSMPIGNTSSAFFKGGQFWWDSDAFLYGVADNSNGNDLFFGLGLKFGFNETLAFRLEAERYEVLNTHLNTYTAGFDFKF